MSETRLSEIRARLEAAIPGPWRVFQDYDDEWFILLDHADGGIVATIEPGRTEGSDAALIAHAPADLAYLLDAVTRLTRELEEARVRERRLREAHERSVGVFRRACEIAEAAILAGETPETASARLRNAIESDIAEINALVALSTPQEASGV